MGEGGGECVGQSGRDVLRGRGWYNVGGVGWGGVNREGVNFSNYLNNVICNVKTSSVDTSKQVLLCKR